MRCTIMIASYRYVAYVSRYVAIIMIMIKGLCDVYTCEATRFMT